jgi:hypothetical protein
MLIEITYNVTDVFVSTTQTPIYVSVSFEQPSGGGGTWGTITGTLSNQTDLQTALDGKFDDPTGTTSQYLRGDGSLATFPSLTGFVPYTGATGDVNLGTHRILAQNATISSSGSGDTATITHSSGSGIGLNITKGGNGEGLYINKTGGSGNAATIIGTINATTLVKSGGTSSQFLKADGTVDSSVYVPTSREITINGVTFDLSANRTFTVGSVTGSGAAGQVAYWTGTSAQTGSADFTWDGNNINLASAKGIVLQRTGSNRNINIISTNIADNFAGATFYPSSGTNVSTAFSVVPKGAGLLTTVKTAIDLFFTDYIANTTNWELGTIRTSSTAFIVTTAKGGTGVNRPILLASGYGTDNATNANQLWLYSNGNVGINTSSDGGQRLQVQGTTLLNGNVTFSSATGMTWDATNSRLGIGTNAPSVSLDVSGNIAVSQGSQIYNRTTIAGRIPFKLFTAATSAFQGGFELQRDSVVVVRLSSDSTTIGASFISNTNFLIGSTTDSGQRLQVTGDTLLKGSGNTSGTNALLVENSDGTDLLTILNNGYTRYGNAGNNAFRVYPSSVAGAGDVDLSGQFLTLNSRSGTTETGASAGFVHINGVSASATSGIQNVLSIQKGFAPTSGTGVHNTLIFNPIINQTGGANGITRGLYVNPTLTAAADWRAIEWSNNSGWGLYGAGTANNYLGGNLLIGSTSNSGERLQVTGTMKVTDTLTVSTGSTKGISFAGTRFSEPQNQTTYTQVLVQPNSGNKAAVFMFAPSGTSNASAMEFYHSFDLDFAKRFVFKNTNGLLQIGADGASLPTALMSNNVNQLYMFGNGNIAIQNGGTFTDIASSKLTINSTTQGFLPPRMTTTQKNAITSPAAGLVVYDTTLNKLCVYTTAWETITSI